MSQGRQFFCQMNVTVTSILFKWTGSHVFLSHILILILLSTVTKNNFMLFLCPLTELQIFEDSCHVSSLRPLFSGEKLSRLLPLIFFFFFSLSLTFSPSLSFFLPLCFMHFHQLTILDVLHCTVSYFSIPLLKSVTQNSTQY